MAISLNGMIARENYKEDFLSEKNWDEFINETKKSGCLIWGRKTYESVKSWDKKYFESISAFTKIIITHQKDIDLDEGFLVADSPSEALELANQKEFKSILLTGGSNINTSFAKLGLIDEVLININPSIIGKGISLFSPEEFDIPLKLISILNLGDDIVQLRYKVLT